jgi:hypothetical protein
VAGHRGAIGFAGGQGLREQRIEGGEDVGREDIGHARIVARMPRRCIP